MYLTAVNATANMTRFNLMSLGKQGPEKKETRIGTTL